MIRFHDILPEIRSEIKNVMTLANPQWGILKSTGRAVEHMDIPMSFCFAQEDEFISVPRGAVSLMKKKVGKFNTEIEFTDLRIEGDAIKIPKLMTLRPRPFQTEAVDKLIKRTQGVCVAGCGGGKTSIGLMAIERIKRKTLVLVHTEDLMEQWIDELREKLGMEAGIIRGAKFKTADVTIAMVKTMVNRVKDSEVVDYLESVGFAIMDEAHHVPAKSFMKVISHVPAKFRLGLTATPKRADGMGKAVFWAFGDELINYSTAQLLKMGFLMLPKLEAIATSFSYSPRSKDIYEKSHEIHRALLTLPCVSFFVR